MPRIMVSLLPGGLLVVQNQMHLYPSVRPPIPPIIPKPTHLNIIMIITSIGTLLLLLNDTLILRGCNLSAMLPRSTFTKYHLLCSQYP